MVEFDLILKYLAGKASPDEAMQVDDWANMSNANKAFLENTHQYWMEAGDGIYTAPNIVNEWNQLKDKIQPTTQVQELKPSKYLWLTRIAAVLAIAATAFAGYYVFNSNNQNLPTLTAEATDKKLDVDLKDGTHVTLAPHSGLIYPVAFANEIREVTLAGNANFDVNHNPAQPFVINMGELHIKVLGTSFAVTTSKKEVQVAVSKGLVAFYNNADTVMIPAGSMATYIKADKKFAVTVTAPPAYGTFQFNKTPLNEVAAKLSAYFKVDIEFKNPATKNCKMSAGFEHQTLKEILTAVEATFDITYKMEGNKILLSGNACK
jgi:ferric-dicitrate binding protein FerR (iron transport regulator)